MGWYGVGIDYMIPRNTGISASLSNWNELIPLIKSMGLDTVRLAFAFSGTGSTAHTQIDSEYVNFDQIIQLLIQNNLKIIFDLHNSEDMYNFFGSDGWASKWADLVSHLNSRFPSEPRFLAWEIFNEPNHPPVGNYDSYDNLAIPDDGDKCFRALVKGVDAIRATGDSRTIVYPSPYFLRTMVGEDELDTSIPSGLVRSNVVVTMHEWCYSESCGNLFSNHANTRYPAWLNADWNLWLGEYGQNSDSLVQQAWAADWTKYVLDHNMEDVKGFCWWMHHHFPGPPNWNESLDAFQTALNSAGFVPTPATKKYVFSRWQDGDTNPTKQVIT